MRLMLSRNSSPRPALKSKLSNRFFSHLLTNNTQKTNPFIQDVGLVFCFIRNSDADRRSALKQQMCMVGHVAIVEKLGNDDPDAYNVRSDPSGIFGFTEKGRKERAKT